MLEIEISNRQSALQVDARELSEMVRRVLQQAGFTKAQISVAVVNDEEIAELNARYLGHEGPTDVLSFSLGAAEPDLEMSSELEGEIVVSAETAIRSAAVYGWAATSELLLYVTHGALHLVGYEDDAPQQRAEMRAAERRHLAQIGLTPPAEPNSTPGPDITSSTDTSSTGAST